jgi:hypothetical protein
MAILFDADELARDFVLEYLDREPEWVDVGEFIDDRLDEYDSDVVIEVHNSVIAYLDTIAQRFADSED